MARRNSVSPGICAQCGTRLAAGWKTCQNCRRPVTEPEMSCSGCGERMKPHWNLCPRCEVRPAKHRGPEPSAGEKWTDPVLGMPMVYIPGGVFMMGSHSPESTFRERPAHSVSVHGFWMGRYPVTGNQWEIIMGRNPSRFKGWVGTPVEHVNCLDVEEFIGTLNRMSGLMFRLPTEAEWEYACRGGVMDDRYGPLDDIAWYRDNSGERSHPVGEKKPNAFGLFDMLGNVWEWCQDVYWGYCQEELHNPRGSHQGYGRIGRGGSWYNSADRILAPHRADFSPSCRSDDIGFRLVRD